MKLLHRNGEIIYSVDRGTISGAMQDCAKARIDMRGLDLPGTAMTGHESVLGADLRKSDLRCALLEDSILSGADFSEALLAGSSLIGSELKSTRLIRAKMRGANLFATTCRRADFAGADLRDAKLRSADLRAADLTDCDLRRADLQWAAIDSLTVMRGAKLAGANLTGETWEDYLYDFLPKFLTSNGKRLCHVIEGWGCHNWSSCPMAIAFGVSRPEDAPREIRQRLDQFVQLYDLRIIPKPKIA